MSTFIKYKERTQPEKMTGKSTSVRGNGGEAGVVQVRQAASGGWMGSR